jgi:hypothetical protein
MRRPFAIGASVVAQGAQAGGEVDVVLAAEAPAR